MPLILNGETARICCNCEELSGPIGSASRWFAESVNPWARFWRCRFCGPLRHLRLLSCRAAERTHQRRRAAL